MVEYEDYPQEYIKRTSVCGAVLSESNLDTGRKTTGQPKEKDPHGVSYKEKQSDQARTRALRWNTEGEGGFTQAQTSSLGSQWFEPHIGSPGLALERQVPWLFENQLGLRGGL